MRVKNAILAGVMAVVSVFGGLAVSGNAMAAVTCPPGSANSGQANTYADCNIKMEGQPSLWNTVQTILNVIIGCIGIAAVAVIVLGGITFVTSQGDAGKVAKGKNTIIYGIVGLIVAILAFAIVNFILTSVFGGTGAGGVV